MDDNRQDAFSGHAAPIGNDVAFAQAVFERSGCVILAVSSDNTILRVNPAFEIVTGYSASEFVGKSYFDVVVRPEFRDRSKEKYEEHIHSKQPVVFETQWQRKAGGVAFVEGSATVMYDAEGK